MKRTVVVLAFAALLLGCSTEPEVRRVDVGPTPEKVVLAALTKVVATDAQRIAVLNAYDSRNSQLIALDKRDADGWRGTVYDPRSGQTYRVYVRRSSAARLDVKGCFAFICETQQWSVPQGR